MGLSPLHTRLMHMFSRLDDQGHEVNMDNLYNSVNFACASFNLEVEENGELVKKRVKTQGVTRGSGRGVPACVKQEEPKGKAAQDAARGTTKLAVLRGDPSSQNLLVSSCYDQKPFYMLSHVAPSVNWVQVSKKVWSNELKKQVEYNFLRWSLSNNYNYEMNDNDIADQYRLVYRCLCFQRNTKWWWAEFLFVWEVTLVNAFWMMVRYHYFRGLQVPYTHYQFHEAVAWAILDPVKYWRTKNKQKSATPAAVTKQERKAPAQAQRPRLTEAALGPDGTFTKRLDCRLGHFPCPVPEGKIRTTIYQLHCLANRAANNNNQVPPGTRTNVYVCGGCNVALCVKCWEDFHKTECFKIDNYAHVLLR